MIIEQLTQLKIFECITSKKIQININETNLQDKNKDVIQDKNKDVIQDKNKDVIQDKNKDVTNIQVKNENKNKNKGVNARGSNTNKNGLPYELLTDLNDCFILIEKNMFSSKIKFNNCKDIFIRTKQSHLFKCMDKHIDKNIKKGNGCKNPDECYINDNIKTIFIIEKKFQQVCGSVCEKIQTPDFKIWQYNRTFPKYNIVYIYCLSEWFKTNCHAEIEYLKYKKIPIFWGNSKTYKLDIINYIISYKKYIINYK
jgi:hypothetical protein